MIVKLVRGRNLFCKFNWDPGFGGANPVVGCTTLLKRDFENILLFWVFDYCWEARLQPIISTLTFWNIIPKSWHQIRTLNHRPVSSLAVHQKIIFEATYDTRDYNITLPQNHCDVKGQLDTLAIFALPHTRPSPLSPLRQNKQRRDAPSKVYKMAKMKNKRMYFLCPPSYHRHRANLLWPPHEKPHIFGYLSPAVTRRQTNP